MLGAKMALWNGKRTPTARDIPVMPAIAYWDAIENVAWQRGSRSATSWNDLLGNCDAAAQGGTPTWDDFSFVGNGAIYFTGTASAAMLSAISTNTFTLEMVIDYKDNAANTNHVQAQFGVISSSNQRMLVPFWDYSQSTYITERTQESRTGISIRRNGVSNFYIRGDGTCGCFGGSYTYARGTATTTEGAVTLGAFGGTVSALGYATRGRIMAIRFHDKILTEAEVAANWNFSVARFELGGAS